MNKTTIYGRLGKDPETKTFDNGSVTNFTVAVDESYKDKDGKKVEKTEWFNIAARNKQGEVIAKFFKKGDPILLEAKKRDRSWEQNGEKKYITEFWVTEFKFVGSTSGSGTTSSAPTTSASEDEDSDLPF